MAEKGVLTKANHLPYEKYLEVLERLRLDEKYEMELYMRVAFFTACRYCDVSSLRWRDIYRKDEIIITEKKTGKTRRIPVNDAFKKSINEIYEASGQPDLDYMIIPSDRDPKTPLSIQMMNKRLKMLKCYYRLDIKHFSTHTLRKTFGRYVFERNGRSGEALILLSKIFKHSSIQMTEAYIGLDDEAIEEVYAGIAF